ncbi:F-box and WD repeat domain-containing 11-A-like [Daphnia pulex]|uniref:F-box and WD repeat domain-containing 11-A-like n=1 Tax=Daphnia pulex TaxID=6669 RepID=UPI001EDF9EFD|nr:F-box and WD repeat domain-containing 11-A-like [Daphnia pulex]
MERDILCFLKGGYPHLTDKILNLLDARSLANAELVCRQWRSYIADGRCWKKYLQSKKVTSIPNIFSWAECSRDVESDRHHTKQDWMKIHNFYQKLEDNWQSASCRQQEIVISKVFCLSVNASKIFTAEYDQIEDESLIKTWNRKSLNCERVFTEENKLRVTSMDCDDDFLVTMSINSPRSSVAVGTPKVSTIFVRELQSGKVLHRIMANFGYFDLYSRYNFKVCCGHGWLISIRIVSQQQNANLIPQDDVLKSRLDVWRMTNAKEIGAKGTVCLGPISKSSFGHPDPVLIGHDENYIVVHRSDPPRFEVVSTSSLNLTRTIDAFDYCPSAKFKDGLIVSVSTRFPSQMIPGTTFGMIRLWDVETGLCLREIQDPILQQYSRDHQFGFTTNYLITVPNVTLNKKRVYHIRDLSVAMDLHSNQTNTLTVLATLERDWNLAAWDPFIVDDFQLIYKNPNYKLVVHSFAPQV